MDAMAISPKKLTKLASRWQKRSPMGRKKAISCQRVAAGGVSSSMMGEKGTFVIYSIDKSRFVLPLTYLSNCIFQELFKMAEEEFGLSNSEHIILPFDSLFMNYIISLIQRGMTADLEKALLANSVIISSTSCPNSTNLHQGQTCQQLLLCGY